MTLKILLKEEEKENIFKKAGPLGPVFLCAVVH